MRITTLIILMTLVISCNENTSSDEGTQDEITNNERSESQSNDEQIMEQDESANKLSTIDYETAKNYVINHYKGFKGYGTTYTLEFYEGDEKVFITGDFDNDDYTNFMIGHDCNSETVDCWGKFEIYEEQPDKTYNLITESGPLSIKGYKLKYNQKSNVISIIGGDKKNNNEDKLRYEKKHDNYILIGSEMNTSGDENGDGSGNRSINFSTGKGIDNFKKWDFKKQKLVALPEENFDVPSSKVNPIFLENFAYDTMEDHSNRKRLEEILKASKIK